MSPFLDKPLRPRHVVIADILANMRDSYIVIDLAKGEPYGREFDLGQSFERIVADMIEGQYAFRDRKTGHVDSPCAVLRISRHGPTEVVTEKVAEAVLQHLIDHPDKTYDEEGRIIRNAFLDEVMPDWECRLPHGPGRISREDAA